MQRWITLAGVVALAFGLAAMPASAQKATIRYIVPQDLDPPVLLTFRQSGETRTTDDRGNPLTGRALLDNGLEQHGRIPSTENGRFSDIVEVHMFFTFAGEVDIQTEARFNYGLWRVFNESNGAQKFWRLIKAPDSAPINDSFDPDPQGPPDESFGLMLAQVENDPGGSFANAALAFRAFTDYQGTTFGVGLTPDTVGGGASTTGWVYLSRPLPNSATFALASDNPNVSVPGSVTIPAGSMEAKFPVKTLATTSTQFARISATQGNVVRSDVLTIHPPIKSVTVSPKSVSGGCKKVVGKVILNGPASADLVIALSEDHPAASLPVGQLTIPAGKTSKTFAINTTVVSLAKEGKVTASYGSVSKSALLTVRPIAVANVFLDPTTVVGPATVRGTVVLECPAAPGDIVVTLSSNNPPVAVPTTASVTVPRGANSATFRVSARDVSRESVAAIKARAQNTSITKSRKLTVKP